MHPQLPHIIVITGPTASGKTGLALSLARRLPVEIISADSRQIFRHLDIGTAKPSAEERRSVPHHFIDIRDPDERYNAGDFQEEGRRVISEIFSRKNIPLIVGGTGLYIQAIVDGFFEQPEISGEVRSTLEARLVSEGKEALYRELQTVDPESAAAMDASKFRRVIRALEVFRETGTPISAFHKAHAVRKIYDAHYFGLRWDRKELYARIERRTDEMFAAGFLEEVRRLKDKGYDDRLQALQTVGYREAFSFLRREISEARMIELMKQNTRRFAKRQMTWFRSEERIQWLPITGTTAVDEITNTILQSLPFVHSGTR